MYWNSLNDYLRRRYGRKVYKLALSSGCSCPNRDGTLGKRGCIFCDGAGAFAETGDIPGQLAAARRRVAAKAGPDPRFIAYFQSFTNTYVARRLSLSFRRCSGDSSRSPYTFTMRSARNAMSAWTKTFRQSALSRRI